ncbi:unnamed protein product [Brassicogethes aeneus]|uniref:VPS37 C-terminal domain-containing protein n=1 Tax=Brassicogethes aeneus TaxID=1431903 RepID=A0A9P0FK22_BRAAE|nr:unnamed protein product [Brassicogethes aeneus]
MQSRMYKTDADIRKSQINTLKVFNANVNEVSEGQEYQIAFDSGCNKLILNVLLGSEFPKEKPKLKISPVVIHPWVNAEGEITSAPGLLNFTVHSDLGRVVQAITREFERNPPPLIGHDNKKMSPCNSVLDGEHSRTSPSFPTLPVIKSFSPPSHTPITSQFPQLNHLSIEELQFLKENADRQQEFIEEMQCINNQQRVLDECIAQIEELAESNLSKQQQLEDLRFGIDSRIEEVTKLAFENERLLGIYQDLSDKYSPRNIQDQLRIAASQAELEGEKIAENFLKGEMDVDRFVNQYISTRKLCQMRKTKEEKLGHQLDSLEKAGF